MRLLASAILLCALAAPVAAHADRFDFTVSTTGTGTLNGTPFTGASFIISGSYDTSRITSFNPGISIVRTSSFSYTIDGFPMVKSTQEDFLFVNQTVGFGVGVSSGLEEFLDGLTSGLSGVDFTTAFGPVTGTYVPTGDPTIDLTTGGELDLSDASDVTINVTAATVPEPSSLMLLSTAVLGVAGVVRRRLTRV